MVIVSSSFLLRADWLIVWLADNCQECKKIARVQESARAIARSARKQLI